MFYRPHFLSPWSHFVGMLGSLVSAPALFASRMRRSAQQDVEGEQREPPSGRRLEDLPPGPQQK